MQAGKDADVRLLQFLNAYKPIVVQAGKDAVVRLVQSLNARVPIVVILLLEASYIPPTASFRFVS